MLFCTIIFCVIIYIFMSWCLYCNYQTWKQRAKMINDAYADRITGSDAIFPDDVMTYRDHLWLLLQGKDAMERYKNVK